MKRLTVWMAALALLVLLTACGGESGSGSGGNWLRLLGLKNADAGDAASASPDLKNFFTHIDLFPLWAYYKSVTQVTFL